MRVENVDIKAVKPYDKNAKKHPREQIEKIAKSLSEFGWQQPLVIDKDGVLVIGHGRLLAAKKLGMTEVPCIRADQLSEQQIKALRLADNRVAESDWDKTLLDLDLSDIVDFDMGDFGFDLSFDDEEETEDDTDDGIVEDTRPASVRHNVFENQERMQFVESNYYGIPQMRPTQTVGSKMWRFCDWNECSEPEQYIAHFYYDDFKFMAAWREPDKYVEKLRYFKAVIAPNFSVYQDFPRCLQILSCYRRSWCGAYWQSLGLDVIPCVMWGDRESWNYCFEGLPIGGTVSVSTVTAKKYLEQDDDWYLAGYNEMLRRLKPTTILVYGDAIEGMKGNIIQIPPYYTQRREILNERIRKKEARMKHGTGKQ